MKMTQLGKNFFVGAQIAEDDLALLANEGFTDIVCNRPDEEHPESATSTKLSGIAKIHGLSFHYHPITPGEPFGEQAEKLAHLAARPNAKVFAYCRSGTRSSNAWSLAKPS